MISLMLSTAGVTLSAAGPIGAQGTPPVTTQQVVVKDPGDVSAVTGHPVSLADDGRSIGWTQIYGTHHNDRYWVLDRHGWLPLTPEQKELTTPALATLTDGASGLSGDGKTFVATYAINTGAELGACSRDPGDADVGIQYWNQQIIRWERSTRTGMFDDPTLVTASTQSVSAGCNATAPSADNPTGPPMMGRGANGPSRAPSVSVDGTVVAFTSAATDLGFNPTEPGVQGLYVWTEGTGLDLVTPVGLDGDVEDPSVSGDGDSIVFSSSATNVTGSPTDPGVSYVYIARRPGSPGPWTIEMVSKSSTGALPTAGGNPASSYSPTVDADGNRVAFLTRGRNLDPGVSLQEYGNEALVVRDLVSEDTRVMVFGDPGDVPHQGYWGGIPALTGDGLRVVIWAWRENALLRMGLGEDRLRLYDVDLALSDDAEDRAESLVAAHDYAPFANTWSEVAISRSDDPPPSEEDTLIAFPAIDAPLDRYSGDPAALYLVGGGGIGPDISRGWHGDPVDTATGNFRHDEVDLTAPPGAGPMTLTRTYTSKGDVWGVFGWGWMSPLDERIEPGDDDTADFIQVNGQRVAFAIDDNLDWSPVGADRFTLEEDDGWVLTGPDGSIRRFDWDGRLVAVEAPGLPTVEIDWEGDDLVSMTSSSGYEVTLVDDTSYSDSVPGSGADG